MGGRCNHWRRDSFKIFRKGSPRKLRRQIPENQVLYVPIVYSFFDAFALSDSRKARSSNIPEEIARLIDRANNHPPFLGILGILPGQLRRILRAANFVDIETSLEELSKTLFFAGYRIWAQRQRLVRESWKNAPGNRNMIKDKSHRKHQTEQKSVQTRCKNPFHFLQRHQNLSRQRATKCPCSKEIYNKKTIYVNDVRTFIHKFPALSYPKAVPMNPISETPKRYAQLQLWKKRDDLIRSEHDRAKIHPHSEIL